MMFDQSFFGIAPKPFHSVDIDFPGRESLFVVDFQMPIPTEHQRIITSKFVCIDHRPSANCFHRQVQERLGSYILDHFNPNYPIALQNPENRDFVERASSSLTFSPSPKVGLIQLNLSTEKFIPVLTVQQDSHPNGMDGFENGGVAETDLLGNLSGRQLQLKELKDPQPGSIRDAQLIDPASGEIMEGVFTTLAAKLFPFDTIDFIARTPTAETTVVFPT